MGDLRQATDTEVTAWTTARYLKEYGGDVMITDLEDVGNLVGQAAGRVHERSAAHLITEIAVWPFPAEAEALITLDLPSGIRLCTLCISHKHLIPDHAQAADSATVIHQVLANVLSAARTLAEEYETEASRLAARQSGNPAGRDSSAGPGRPLTGISRHFAADEIEALVITAAEAVCGQLDDLSTRQADLAARAYDLMIQEYASPPDPSPRQQAGLPAQVWVLRHDDKHGDDVSLYASHADGLGALAQTVRFRWDNIAGEPGVPGTGDALDDSAAVEMYFRCRSGCESYSLYSETVAGIRNPGNLRGQLSTTTPDTGIDPGADPADAIEGAEQEGTCSCGEPIVLYRGHWLHLYNPECTGADDHDARPS